MPESNRVELTAVILERNVLRYSPAGLPILECRLSHSSMQVEARQSRQVDVEVAAMGAGEIAVLLNQAPMGQPHRFFGFVANKSRSKKSVVFHITEFELQGV